MSHPWLRRLAVFAAALAAIGALFGAAEALYRAVRFSQSLLAARVPAGAFELYVVGESTAEGAPYFELAPAALLVRQFGGRIRGREIRVFTLARGGESIYPQAVALERALLTRNADNPGAVLVYSGHNDAGTTSGVPPFERAKETVLFRSALLRALLFHAERKSLIPRVRTLGTWEYHLRRVIELSLDHGLVPVLATPVSNMSDMDPDMVLADTDASRAVLEQGQRLESAGRCADALRLYAAQHGGDSHLRNYLKYRMGRCYRALGRYQDAKRCFQEVVDAFGWGNFGRATSRQNELLRSLAREYSIPLADAAKVFAENSPHGILGDELFVDGQHPNIKGYLLLGRAYASRVSDAFQEPIRRPLPGPEKIAREVALGKAEQARALVVSGRFLFSVATRQACPGLRLRKARARFQDATRLAPDDFSAWLGLGLTEAALRRDLLSQDRPLEQLGRLRLFHGERYALSPDQLAEILALLEQSGVPESLRRSISRTYRPGP